MTITVLIDNTCSRLSSCHRDLTTEWGLSLYIEFEGHQYLLDMGQSGRFAQNAEALGIDLRKVDAAVLSHAHFDHANGMPAFFAANRQAPLYVREGTGEDCYHQIWLFRKYIGIRKGLLAQYANRIRYVSGCYALADKVWLIPHDSVAKSATPYSSPHEQSLVFDTEQGLVICSSCSHAGIETILDQVREALPNKKVYAFVGGLHLFRMNGKDVRHLANRLSSRLSTLNCSANGASSQLFSFYVGHCTGNRALTILQQTLPFDVQALFTGQVITL